MRRLEMQDAYKELGIRGQRYRRAKVGDKIETKRGTYIIQRIHKNGLDPCFCEIVIHGEDDIILDCSPHWERGPQGPVKTCHIGVVNLIHGVYRQVDADYERLYITRDVELARNLMETDKEYRKRKSFEYERQVHECENFLGPVLCKFAKIRAMWDLGMSPESIAYRLNESEEHICAIVDRLGLMGRPKDDDDEFDI